MYYRLRPTSLEKPSLQQLLSHKPRDCTAQVQEEGRMTGLSTKIMGTGIT